MEASIRFLRRHPPLPGWWSSLLAVAAVMILPMMMSASPLRLSAEPMLLGVLSGLLLGFVGGRRVRPLVIIPALLIPLILLELLPPWRVVEADLRTLLDFSGPRGPLLLPAAVAAAFSGVDAILRAAWDGNADGLNWALSRLLALLGFAAAGLLGLGMRRRALLLPWSMLLIAAIAVTAITARLAMSYVIIGVFLTLFVTIFASFTGRESAWDRTGISYSDALRWDVALGGVVLLVLVVGLGFLVPSVPRNALTTWIWTDVRLPAGLARLDKDQGDDGPDRFQALGRAQLGRLRSGEDLALGRSLETAGSEQVAMRIRASGVTSEALPYWRGRIFERYEGRGWTTGDLRMIPREPFVTSDFDSGLIRQEITDLLPGRGQRFGLPDIIGMEELATLEQTTLGEAVGWVGAGPTYTVYSLPPAPVAANVPEQIELQSELIPYRERPENLPQRVVELTNQITGNAGSQTARALAIETYLRSLPYSYEVEPLRPGGDAVDQFLFTMRSGYCTYYASAMAVMARIVGIPSRVAVGYASGAYDPATGVFTVREAEAHAWPELYIDGQGWTRWEPTPVRDVPPRSTRVEQTPDLTIQETEEPATGANYLGLILLGVALLLLVVAIRQRLNSAPPLNPAAVHADLYRYGRRVGVLPARGDSVEDYARRLSSAAPAVYRPLARVGRLLTARLYRDQPLTPNESRDLVRDWHIVRDMLRRKPSDRL